MPNRRMSETLKEEIAKELGLYEVIKKGGFGAVTSRDCQNMLSRIETPSRNKTKP